MPKRTRRKRKGRKASRGRLEQAEQSKRPEQTEHSEGSEHPEGRRARRILDKVFTALLGLVVLLALLAVLPGSVDGRFTVDVNLADGVAEVDGELRNLRHPVIVLWLLADAEKMASSHFEAVDEDGDAKLMIGWGRWRLLFPGLSRTVYLRYDARLGVRGRHGYQGKIEPDFALLQTSLLMWLPSPYWITEEVHLKVNPPPGQDVLCAWPQDEEGWYAAAVEEAHVYRPVMKTAVGVGRFDVAEVEANGQVMQVATHERFEPELRELAVQRAGAMFSHLQKLLGFELHYRYLNIFVPSASDGGHIFGASWSLGHSYEMQPGSLRRWELFGHRIGHAFNRDKPYGLELGQGVDRWFYEAFASWIEIPLTQVAGVATDDGRFGYLFRRYWNGRERDGVDYDRPPSDDRWVRDHDIIEYLHYSKYPHVLVMLDWELRGRDGEPARGVEGLFAHLYKRYGNHAAPIPDLRAEMEAFSGRDLGWFFERYVEASWPLLPLWRSHLARAEAVAAELPSMATLEDVPVRADAVLLRMIKRDPNAAPEYARGLLRARAGDVVIQQLGLRHLPEGIDGWVIGMQKPERDAVEAHQRRVIREHFSTGGCKSTIDPDAYVAERLAGMKLRWEPGYEQLGGSGTTQP